MTQPGELNRRLVLEVPVESGDGAGGVMRSFQRVSALWASVEPVSARENVSAASLGATITHRIVIRGGREVTPRHRLRDGARIYRIVAVRERAGRRFVEIEAEEQQ